MILPRGGHLPDCAPVLDARKRPKGYCSCAKAHIRMSTLSGVLDDGYGLQQWKMRNLLVGAGRKPHIGQQATVATMKELGLLVEEADAASDAGIASARGSYMHRLTERLDNGIDLPGDLTPNVRAMLAAYHKAMARFEVIDTERFVVCERLKAAGTYDKRLRDRQTGKVIIADTKTGQDLDRMILKTTVQVTGYAHGDLYSLDGDYDSHGASHQWGAVIWLPWRDDPEEAECSIRYLDLAQGRKLATLAQTVYAAQKMHAGQFGRSTFPWDAPGVRD